jgi:integral membrane sensor domain MASE1
MWRKLSYATVTVLLTFAYFGAGKLGLSLAFLNASASAVWPPSGLAIAAVLLLGYRATWPAIFVGAFLVNLTTAGTVTTSLAIAAGNTLEAVAGAAIARRFAGGAATFKRAGDVVRFVIFAAIPSAALSATIGVTALARAGYVPGPAAPVWLTWWTGDFVSDLVVAPLLLIWFMDGPPRLRAARLIEGAGLIVATLCVSWVVFVGHPFVRTEHYPLEYLCVPVLIWAAFRFERVGAITAAFLMSAVAVVATRRGMGPFAVGDPNESLLLLQTFVGVIALTAVILAAAVAERRSAEATLRATRGGCVRRWRSGSPPSASARRCWCASAPRGRRPRRRTAPRTASSPC